MKSWPIILILMLCVSCARDKNLHPKKWKSITLPTNINVIATWANSPTQRVSVMWGTNSGVYQWTNIVSGTNSITISNLLKGVRYYFASASVTNGSLLPDMIFPTPPPTNFYSLFAQSSTNVTGPFTDLSTNAFLKLTNNLNQFFRIRISVSQKP